MGFYGVKVARTKTPAYNPSFVLETLYSDYYVEMGTISEIPLTIEIEVCNNLKKPVHDIEIRCLGLRRDPHQEIVKTKSTYELKTETDELGNFYHETFIPVLRPKAKVRIPIRYLVKTRPFKVVNEEKCFKILYDWEKLIQPAPYQRYRSGTIGRIVKRVLSDKPFETIRNTVYWIIENIKYERTYVRLSATDTIRRKKGSCLSISDLIVTILRACDIPATVIRGLYKDNPHAWVEAYIVGNTGVKIVPIDALAGIVGGIGSVWISQHAELSPRTRNVELIPMKGLYGKYNIMLSK